MSVTTDELNSTMNLIADLRRQEDNASSVKREITKQLEAAENKMLEMLEASGLKSFKDAHGRLATISYRDSVKLPVGEDRSRYFQYLKETGEFDALITVNSMTLNSWYKDKKKFAIEKGELDFNVPGINGITTTAILSFRRG